MKERINGHCRIGMKNLRPNMWLSLIKELEKFISDSVFLSTSFFLKVIHGPAALWPESFEIQNFSSPPKPTDS